MSNEKRRKLLKSIAAGSGAVIAGKNLPESWNRPLVDSVMLPAHAQTSGGNFTGALNLGSLDLDNTMLASLVSRAHAGNGMSPHDILCIEVMGSAFRFGLLVGTLDNPLAIYRLDASEASGTVGGNTLFTQGVYSCTPDSPNFAAIGLKVIKVDAAGAHYELYDLDTLVESGILPLGNCPWDMANMSCVSPE